MRLFHEYLKVPRSDFNLRHFHSVKFRSFVISDALMMQIINVCQMAWIKQWFIYTVSKLFGNFGL